MVRSTLHGLTTLTTFYDTFRYAAEHFSGKFKYDFFDKYYTGSRIPSWEDNDQHLKGINLLDKGMAVAGTDAIEILYTMEPRMEFDQDALKEVREQHSCLEVLMGCLEEFDQEALNEGYKWKLL